MIRLFVRHGGGLRYLGVLRGGPKDLAGLVLEAAYVLSFSPPRGLREIEFFNREFYVRVPSETVARLVAPVAGSLAAVRETLARHMGLEAAAQVLAEAFGGGFGVGAWRALRVFKGVRLKGCGRRVKKRYKAALKALEGALSRLEAGFAARRVEWRPPARSGVTMVDSYKVDVFSVKVFEEYGGGLGYHVMYAEAAAVVRTASTLVSRYVRRMGPYGSDLGGGLDDVLDERARVARRVLDGLAPELMRHAGCISRIAAYKSTGLLRFMPFLLEDELTEFYLDAPDTQVYVDHVKHGRCVTNVRPGPGEVDAFITHVVLETGCQLNEKVPSLKADIRGKRFRVRVSIDVPPLTVDGPAIDVRKYRVRAFTLPELVEQGFISLDAAATLLLYARHRANIAIVGEPGSGKTTLLNAVDLCLPAGLRKIYVEDVVESVSQLSLGRHQVRLQVDAVESRVRLRTKSEEIVKLLHRKPDYVILGELQDREHFEAAFNAMVAGLKCIQTCHADGVRQFLHRVVDTYGIPRDVVYGTLNLVVLTRRALEARELRYVSQIAELDGGRPEGFVTLYRRALGAGLVAAEPLSSSPFLRRLAADIGMPFERLEGERLAYRRMLRDLAASRRVGIEDVARAFSRPVLAEDLEVIENVGWGRRV